MIGTNQPNKDTSAPVMVAMSGGVDSAVAAHCMAEVASTAGVTMQLSHQNEANTAAAPRDAEEAAAVCRMLGIPHYVADLSEIFREKVIGSFIAAYQSGDTPNPCVDCNKHVKFGALLDFATQKGYSSLATGHYARVERGESGRMLLRRAADKTKDQSYMLYSLTQDVLQRVRFPLGELSKSDVREIAASLDFPMAQKRDSQDICFVPDGDYASFISRMLGCEFPKGPFLSSSGEVLGEHNGMIHYTIGQRKGLGIALGHPAFVIAKSAADNSVTLGDSEALFSTRVVARGINLIPFDRMNAPLQLSAKARYRQEAAPARVEQTAPDELTVEFATPQRAITSGQSLVIYDGDYVIGGGKIVKS